jgi:hypothetical protein
VLSSGSLSIRVFFNFAVGLRLGLKMNLTTTDLKFGTCYQCTLWIMHVKFHNHIPNGSLSIIIFFNLSARVLKVVTHHCTLWIMDAKFCNSIPSGSLFTRLFFNLAVGLGLGFGLNMNLATTDLNVGTFYQCTLWITHADFVTIFQVVTSL